METLGNVFLPQNFHNRKLGKISVICAVTEDLTNATTEEEEAYQKHEKTLKLKSASPKTRINHI